MPRILWLSPYSLHDLSSGASIHCKTLLENLALRGFQVWSCASFILDVPYGANAYFDVQKLLSSTDKRVFELDDNNIHYIYARCESTIESEHSLDEQNFFYELACEVLSKFNPDFVIGFGTSMASMTLFAEAKRRGIYTIYPVVNGNHGNYSFPHVDFILTDSEASAKLYQKRDRMCMIPCREFFDPRLYMVPQEAFKPRYVTMVNPSFEKGVNIMAALAQKCQKDLPDVKFLVVNSRSNFAEAINYLHPKDKRDEHPLSPDMFPNVSMVGPTRDMRRIYAETKVLLAPSLWWESWGRVATEATLNGIPVLASNSGGLPEATGGAGIHLTVPEHCLKDFTSLPTEDEIVPWFDALKTLLTEDQSAKLQAAKEQLSVDKTLDKVINVLMPYINRQPRQYIHYGFGEHYA